MKIAICDDEQADIDLLIGHIKKRNSKYEITVFNSANIFLERVKQGDYYDLLFLDVQMPDSNGWLVAKELKQSGNKMFIAMTTVMKDYIYDCFDRVDYFVGKPVSEERTYKILDIVQEKLFPKLLTLQMGSMFLELKASEIVYIEVRHNDLHIHTESKLHKIRLSLAEIKKIINTSMFSQPHQSFIVNLKYFNKMTENNIIMKDGSKIPLSRKRKNDFIHSLKEYIRKG